jgi:hypothetical protein
MADIINTRIPFGITNVGETHPLADMGQLAPSNFITVFDDFVYVLDATTSATDTWLSVDDSGTGTNAFQNVVGGVYNVVTAASDNDYHAMVSQNKNFQFLAGKKGWFEARVKVAEATVLESTWWVGLTNTTTTGGMQANTAGPLASYDGALFWKTPETAMTLNFETSITTTQNTLSAFVTTVTNTWTKVGFYFDGVGKVYPFAAVNNSDVWVSYAAQAITVSGQTVTTPVFGIKAGPSGAAETLQIDYIFAAQAR